MRASEQLYEKYSFLAEKYANRVFSYEQLSFTKEDLVQEFRMKIWTSIHTYGKRWKEWKETERCKPMPIRYYLEAACSNKVNDFIRQITREDYKVRIDDLNFDFGVEYETILSAESNKFVLNGIDLLEGLTGIDRTIFSLFLRGFNKTFLNKVYSNNPTSLERAQQAKENSDIPLTVNDIIEQQRLHLIEVHGTELKQVTRIFTTQKFNDDNQ